MMYHMTNSQCAQDLFVEALTKKKQNGYFVEIGSNHPSIDNNTYLLEKNYNWKGLLVEYDASFEPLYHIHRTNSMYAIKDAREVQYKEILDTHFPKHIDYLQIDLEVDNQSTLVTLLLLNETVLDTYKFATITFEHDIYRGDYFDTRNISRKIFQDRGYILLFPDVCVFSEGSYKPFEDWYVHPDLVDASLIHKLRTTTSLTCEEIKRLLETL